MHTLKEMLCGNPQQIYIVLIVECVEQYFWSAMLSQFFFITFIKKKSLESNI